jgi:hypothetical protein
MTAHTEVPLRVADQEFIAHVACSFQVTDDDCAVCGQPAKPSSYERNSKIQHRLCRLENSRGEPVLSQHLLFDVVTKRLQSENDKPVCPDCIVGQPISITPV